MKTETKTIYKCEYCNKLYQIKRYCEQHEQGCKKRPDYIRPCHSCAVLQKVMTHDCADMNGYHTPLPVNVLFCKKLDCYIHPPSVAAKGNALELDKLNIEMPKQCDLYETQNEFEQ